MLYHNLQDCKISDSQRLGEVGDGFKQALSILDGGRISIAALSIGIAKGAFEAALKYSQEREQFGKPISSFQGISFKLADMATEIEAAELLTMNAVFRKSNGLKLSKERLIAKSRWTSTLFEESMINEFDITIFAEGHNVSANPYFNWLPFAPAQGEILELDGPRLPLCSNGTWFLPHSSKNAKAGSTWKHEDLKSGPTDKGKKTIYKNLNFLPIDQFKLVNHLSGIRSGTMDRSPIIGRHPKISKLYIFNGFGSRGSTTIKMNADRLAEFIILEKPLNQNIDLNRFKKKIRCPI